MPSNTTTDQPTLAVTDPIYTRKAGWEDDGIVIRESDMAAAREITAKGRIGYSAGIRRGEDFVERVEAVALGHALARTNSEPRPAGDLREAAALLLKRAEAVQEISGGTVQHSDMLVAQIAVSSALATHSPAPMAGEDEDAALLADANSWYSDGQIEEMRDRVHHLRSEVRRCNQMIESGKADAWWREDRDRFQQELRGLEDTLAAHPSTQEGADRG